MNGNTLLNYLPAYKGKEKILKDQQNTNDIINEILKGHSQYVDQYKNISSFFIGNTPKKTLQNIYSFLKKEVKYRVEPESKQTIKSPSAIIATGKTTGSDCKNYSLFTAGILANINKSGIQKIPFCFRFTGYKFFDSQPQHVFIVAYPGTDHEIWVDAVLSKFDYKKPYTFKIDHKPMLVGISGIGKPPKTFAGKILRPVLKVAASPARNAFLALVGLNFMGLATKLNESDHKQPAALKDWWEKFGGRIQNLLGQINRGKSKKRIFGIGAEPVTTSAAATAAVASPILASVAIFLKEVLKKAQPELQDAAAQLITNKARQAAYNASLSKVDRQLINQQRLNEFDQSWQTQKTLTETKSNLLKYAPLILVAGAGIYILTRKK